jgi:ABC-2 type transport system ATP-binding protein
VTEQPAVQVKSVSKNFILPHERVGTLKSWFMSLGRRPSRSTETQHALRNISFEIKQGEFFGIVGRNGSGKSTLLKILAGIYQPSAGQVNVQGRLVPFIELGVGFNPELTGRENVYLNGAMLGFDQKEIEVMYEEIVEFAELERFMDQKLKNYSSGMQVRLAFSMATRAKADILLVDEVLAVGDADFQRKCFDYFKDLKKNKKTVVFVSHDMTAVREYCDRAALIEKNELVLIDKADRVAAAYTRMFVEQEPGKSEEKKGKKWGDGQATYQKVSVSKTKLTNNDEELIITATAKSLQKINNPVFGFSIKSASGQQILGTNTQIKQYKLPSLQPGQTVELSWTIPNIFGEGKHYLDVAIVHHDGTAIAEWWEEAVKFYVSREEKTPYIVSPPVKLEISTHE